MFLPFLFGEYMTTPISDYSVTPTAAMIATMFGLSPSIANQWLTPMNTYLSQYGINTVLRIAAFWGQISVESSNLTILTENLNYSASNLLSTFPKYFNASTANSYANNPSQIGSRVYANRLGNGNESSGDGYTYRGRGLIQVTGAQNYASLTRAGLSCTSNPSVLSTIAGACQSGCWFWQTHGLNTLADMKAYNKITRTINGGYSQLDQRIAMTQRAIQVLTGQTVVTINPSRTTDIGQENSDMSSWSSVTQPNANRKSVYPYNWVYQSRSGHLFEIDDSPDYERVLIMHRGGSFIEFNPDTDIVLKSMRDKYDITEGDVKYGVGGDFTQKVGGEWYIKTSGSQTLDTDANLNVVAAEQMRIKTPLVSWDQTAEGNILNIQTGKCENDFTTNTFKASTSTINTEVVQSSQMTTAFINALSCGSISASGGTCDSLTVNNLKVNNLEVNNILVHQLAQLVAQYAINATNANTAGTASSMGSGTTMTIPSSIGANTPVVPANVDTTTNNNEIASALSATAPISDQTYTLDALPTASFYPQGIAMYQDDQGNASVINSNGTNWVDSSGNIIA